MNYLNNFFSPKSLIAQRKSNIKQAMPVLLDSIEKLNVSKIEKEALKKDIFSEDAKAAAKLEKIGKHDFAHHSKEMIFNFFGMNHNWSLGRNLLGGLMVHCPEYPTYFIPAFTQAKATGEATELKKGEGPRGIITGGLEGIAVGALVSGEMLRPREMGPYILLGAGLQLFSSKVFPWLGEKLGRQIYLRRQAEMKLKQTETPVIEIVQPKTVDAVSKPNNDKTTFTAYRYTPLKTLGNLKI